MEKRLFEYETPRTEVSLLFACSAIIAASEGDPLKLPGTSFDDFIIP